MKVAEAEEEGRRRKKIAAGKQVSSSTHYLMGTMPSTTVLLLVCRQRRNCCQRQRNLSLATAKSRAGIQVISKLLSHHLPHNTHSISLSHTHCGCMQAGVGGGSALQTSHYTEGKENLSVAREVTSQKERCVESLTMESFTVVSVYVQSVRGCSQSLRSRQEEGSVHM